MTDLTEFTYFRGRVALHALLRALGVTSGRKVALQAFTCVAVPEAVLAADLVPQWVDIESDGVNMSPASLEATITDETAVIIVQHTFGIPARIGELVEIARAAGIPIIEDCCHTVLGTSGGQLLGTFGAGAFYSYEWGKPLVAGIGGSATATDSGVATALAANYGYYVEPPSTTGWRVAAQYHAYRALFRPRTYWIARDAFHWLSRIGAAKSNYNPLDGGAATDFNYRMLPASRRRLDRALTQAPVIAGHARMVAVRYEAEIVNERLRRPNVPPSGEPVYARYPLLVDGKQSLLKAARRAGVELADWYSTPVHPLGRDALSAVRYVWGSCPNAESAAQCTVSLPTHVRVGTRDVDRAVEFLSRS